MSRTIAYRGNKMDSIYEVIEERDCDPRPGQYSLWHTGNGSFHSELRNYDQKGSLLFNAETKGYTLTTLP